MNITVVRTGSETVSSSQQHILEKRIYDMARKLLRENHIIYSIDKYTDDTERRRFKADVMYYITDKK